MDQQLAEFLVRRSAAPLSSSGPYYRTVRVTTMTVPERLWWRLEGSWPWYLWPNWCTYDSRPNRAGIESVVPSCYSSPNRPCPCRFLLEWVPDCSNPHSWVGTNGRRNTTKRLGRRLSFVSHPDPVIGWEPEIPSSCTKRRHSGQPSPMVGLL